jgi:hypothetical protein
MSTATTAEPTTGQHTASRSATQPTNTPTTQTTPNAAQRLRTTMAAVRLSFTWLGVLKTFAPEQRTIAARVFHADRELLSASKLILDTKNPAYRAVAAVRSEASGYWRTVTLPFPEAGIRLLPQNSLGMLANRLGACRERLQEAARELSSQYDQIKSEAQRRLGTLRDSNRLRQMVARHSEQIQARVGEMLVDRPRRNILRRGNSRGGSGGKPIIESQAPRHDGKKTDGETLKNLARAIMWLLVISRSPVRIAESVDCAIPTAFESAICL